MGREAAILDYEIVCETNPPNGRFEFDEDRDNYFRQERGGSSDNEEEEEYVEERPERGEAVNDIHSHVDVVDDDRSEASHDAEDRNDYFRQERGGDSDNEDEGTDVWPERRPVMTDDIHGDMYALDGEEVREWAHDGEIMEEFFDGEAHADEPREPDGSDGFDLTWYQFHQGSW